MAGQHATARRGWRKKQSVLRGIRRAQRARPGKASDDVIRSQIRVRRHRHAGFEGTFRGRNRDAEQPALQRLARIDEPEKNWKFGPADIEERKFWSDYRKAYEACLNATSTQEAPWYIIPADDKENARVIVSQIILDTLKKLGMSYPETDETRRKELLSIRELLASESHEDE